MAIWNSKIIQEITGGVVTAAFEGNALIINSNDIATGDIFVALPGSKVDGHDFIGDALKNRAAAAIVKRKVPVNIPQLIVPDVYEAIKKLAEYKRQNVKAKFIAITGSVGKTSTKEMLAKCLAAVGKVFATKGNFNNYLGLPLTMASMPNDAEYVVCELGMSAAGEMTELSWMFKPEYTIITNIYAVHKEFFATVDDIARAKAEIFKGMFPHGTAILNADNDYYHILKAEAEKAKLNIVSCGKNSTCKILKLEPKDEQSSYVEVEILNKRISYTIGSNSPHLISNGLLILALSTVLKADLNKVTAAIANFSDCAGRGELLKVQKWGHQFTIIDDSYNSSPDSLKASLKRLGLFNATRKIAVLSDMLELGSDAGYLHAKMAEEISNNGIDKVITYGAYMKNLFAVLTQAQQMYHAETLEDLEEFLVNNLQTGDLVLFKGSHGTELYKLIKLFKEKNDK